MFLLGESMVVQEFQWMDLDLAPEDSGIYAWYLEPVLRPADLENPNSTKENLLRLANQLKLPSFEVTAKGHLALTLQGVLDHEHMAVGDKSNDVNLSELVEKVIENKVGREIFAKILGSAAPNLMAPLYIGVATNIRQRLKQHKNDIDKYRKLHRSGGDDQILEDEKQKFAKEVVIRGIPNRFLKVYISTMLTEQYCNEEVRVVSEAVETILNRLFFPIMGRR